MDDQESDDAAHGAAAERPPRSGTIAGAASAPSWEDVTVEPCRKRVTPDSRPVRVRRPTESPDAGVASA